MTEKKVTKQMSATSDALKKQVEGFKNFVKDQGLVGMAIGLILGTAAAALVKSFIENIVMPPIGLLLGSAEGLKGLKLNIGRTMSGQIATMNYGLFLNELINFLVVAAVVYFVIVAVSKFFGEDIAPKK